jgi:hypothetical protein
MSARFHRAVLLILGCFAAAMAPLIPGIADKLSSPRTQMLTVKRTPGAEVLHRADLRTSGVATDSWNASQAPSPSAPPYDILRGSTTNKSGPVARSVSLKTPDWQEFLNKSNPKARELFETGMAYLRSGRYTESRLAFQTLIRTFPGDKAEPLAYWTMGLSFCREGGYENFQLAMDQFINWLIFFPAEGGLEDLAQAAHVNATVLGMELMDTAPDEKGKIWAAKMTAQALTQFLKGYPGSIGASDAQSNLAELQKYLSSVGGR